MQTPHALLARAVFPLLLLGGVLAACSSTDPQAPASPGEGGEAGTSGTTGANGGTPNGGGVAGSAVGASGGEPNEPSGGHAPGHAGETSAAGSPAVAAG